MAHKTLIGGTAYEITGGKTLVNGTAYNIKSGKTLVGGTAYEVGFGPAIATITVSSSCSSSAKAKEIYITLSPIVPGTDIVTTQTVDADDAESRDLVYEVPIGSIITCDAKSGGVDGYGVYVNGEFVSSRNYNYTVVGNANISIKAKYINSSTNGYIKITET